MSDSQEMRSQVSKSAALVAYLKARLMLMSLVFWQNNTKIRLMSVNRSSVNGNVPQLWDAHYNSKQGADSEWEHYRTIYESGGFVGPEPSARVLNRSYWTVFYESWEEIVVDQSLFNAALGFEPDEAISRAEKWAIHHDYVDPRPKRKRPWRGARSSFQALKAGVPIELLAERLTELRWHGDTGRGPCPLHRGSNESAFVIYKDSGRFHCFNCLENGDVIDLARMAMDRGLM